MRHVLRPVAAGTRGDRVVHEAEVELAPDEIAEAHLHVHGIATVWELQVNGTAVASDESMWATHVVDVTAWLRPGTNTVTVLSLSEEALRERVAGLPRRPRARWRTRLVEQTGWRWIRSSVLGRAPGFAPGPPVQGPWRPLVLETGTAARVRDLRLRPSLHEGTGVLEVEVDVRGDVTRLEIEVVDRVDGQATTTPVDLVEGRGSARVELDGVRPWWPHTHGDPALHRVRLITDDGPLDLPGDGTAAATWRDVGFRSLGNGSAAGRPETGDASIDLHVNGVRVFCRGVVWTPGDLEALESAAALGFNLVRVPGIGSYESDAFHARCDELGLLVWQDLMLATHDYPLGDGDFAQRLAAEVRTETGRLGGHPSTVVVCGSAEQEQQALWFGSRIDDGAHRELAAFTRPLVEESDIDALWVDSTTTGGVPATRVDVGVAQWFGVGAYRRPVADTRAAGVRFAAECLAFAHPAEPPEEGSAPRDHGSPWDFADVREHYLHERHGPDATDEQRARVAGAVMAEVFGEWRRPASPCGGGIVLWLRDLAPGPGWGLLDHRGRPKPAALELAPVLQPVAVWLVDEGASGLDVHVANDGPEPLVGRLVVSLVAGDRALEEASTDVVVPPHAHEIRGVDELLGRWTDANRSMRFGPASHDRVEVCLGVGHVERRARWLVPAELAPALGEDPAGS